MVFQRAWDGDAWQNFALQLVQLRHKPENIQIVPDQVRGDAGIEFFSTDGCLYQCYAPQEASDVAKAASAMKAKGARDLRKLITYKNFVENVLQSIKARRWILLCPFLDDKEVVAYVRKRGEKIKAKGLSFVAADFEALVHCQGDFLSEFEHLKLQSLAPLLQFDVPSDEEIALHSTDPVSVRLTEKLTRAFPHAIDKEIERQRASYIAANLIRENALDALRTNRPILWERSQRCLVAEERRLVALGSGTEVPGIILRESISRIEQSLHKELPDLPNHTITEIAVGTISDWLLRCPLDFPGSGN